MQPRPRRARGRSSTCSGPARPRARSSTAPSAAPRSTPGCSAHLARIADAALRAHWEREIRARRAALFAPPRDGARRAARSCGTARGRRPRSRAGAAPAAAVTPSAKGSLLARRRAAAPRRGPHPRERDPRGLPQPSRRSRRARGAAGATRLPLRRSCGNSRRPLVRARRAPTSAARGFAGAGRARGYGRDPLPHLDARADSRQPPPRARQPRRTMPRGPSIEELDAPRRASGARSSEIARRRRDRRAWPTRARVILTVRLRAATEAEFNANTRPLEDGRQLGRSRTCSNSPTRCACPRPPESRRPRKRLIPDIANR